MRHWKWMLALWAVIGCTPGPMPSPSAGTVGPEKRPTEAPSALKSATSSLAPDAPGVVANPNDPPGKLDRSVQSEPAPGKKDLPVASLPTEPTIPEPVRGKSPDSTPTPPVRTLPAKNAGAELGSNLIPKTETKKAADVADAKPTKAVGKTERLIGVSLLTLENPFFKVIGDNLTAEAKKHGYDTIVVSADKNVAKQNDQINDFITKKVAAIVLSPCESRSVVPVIQAANKANIPVFTVDIPCREPGVDIVCQVATDNLGGGKEAGKAMIEVLGKTGGKVAILHFKQAESCRLRVEGFRFVIDEFNKTAPRKIDLVMELDGGAAKDLSFKAAEDVLQAHPDLVGIFAINDPSALGARAALEKAGQADRIVIIGFDGQPEGKQAIKDRKIYADPIQFPDVMGIEVARLIVKHSKGEDVMSELLIPTHLYRKADADNDAALK